MNQPPKTPGPPPRTPDSHGAPDHRKSPLKTYRLPQWRLPPGVSAGTWEYTQRESIATEYAEFLKNTPLISLDIDIVLRALGPPMHPGQRVVDLGCGDGRAMRALGDVGYQTIGIDMSQPMLSRVIANAWEPALCVRANLAQLSGIRDGVADHAVCLFSTIGMIRGREHRQTFLRDVARIVRPGGRLVVHVHNRNMAWRDRPSATAYLRSLRASWRSTDYELGDRVYSYRGLADMFLHTYSKKEFTSDLRGCGWRIDELIALSPTSDATLSAPHWMPSLRAGGFIAIASRKHEGKEKEKNDRK